jgi:hypothetical protein
VDVVAASIIIGLMVITLTTESSVDDVRGQPRTERERGRIVERFDHLSAGRRRLRRSSQYRQ